MKVLVTGGAGFIGSHVVDNLLRKGYEVVVLDNLSTGSKKNVNEDARFVLLDIRDEAINQLIKQESFDGVIHLAAQTSVPHSLIQPYYDCDVNVQGTVNILEACRNNNVQRIVFASSAATYGKNSMLPLTEEAEALPTSFYGLSKLTAEKYLSLYNIMYGLEFVVLRYANVYGERQGENGEGGVISTFTRQIYNEQVISIFGDGGQTRDFIYVGDVAEANCAALETAFANRCYNISTAQETSINHLAEVLLHIANRNNKIVYSVARDGDIYRSVLANTMAKKYLKWLPKFELADGLARTYKALANDFHS